jgi:hypothetical protein
LDGLIGIYPVGELDMYVQISFIHQPGDINWHNINMDRDVYQQMLVHLLLPDKKKKKMKVNNNITLQQDRAKSHLQEDDEVFIAKVTVLFGDPNSVELSRHEHQ